MNFDVNSVYDVELVTVVINIISYTLFTSKFTVPTDGNYLLYYMFNAPEVGSLLSIKNTKLEIGNKATDWTAAPEDLDYLTNAMQSNTSIEGGLLSTTLLQVKDNAGNVTGGLSGLATDNIVLFGGGTYNDAIQSATTPSAVAVIDRKDGSGHRAKGAPTVNFPR